MNSSTRGRRLIGCLLAALLIGVATGRAQAVARAGLGSFATALPPGAKEPAFAPPAIARAPGPVPTNDWWSSLLARPYSDNHYAHPLAVRLQADGLAIRLPGLAPGGEPRDIAGAPGEGDLVLGLTGDAPPGAKVIEDWSDWFVRVRLGTKARGVSFAYGHGSPYVFVRADGGGMRLVFAAPPVVWHEDAAAGVYGLRAGAGIYGVFVPPGSVVARADDVWESALSGRGHYTVAALPDAEPATLARLAARAHNHVTDTRVAWRYDVAASEVTTDYEATVEALEPGAPEGTVFALYPHQWRALAAPAAPSPSYGTVRGAMRLVDGKGFRTRLRFNGVLPFLPAPAAAYSEAALAELDALAAEKRGNGDTYWGGKELAKLAGAAEIARQAGRAETATRLAGEVKGCLQDWFDASDAAAPSSERALFYRNRAWGALIGYPASYGSDTDLNDHHFHHGYFIRAAAEVARADPAWAADSAWGAMVKALIRDIASPDRADPAFPFLRSFDPYAGHSWASGFAKFGDGNNQESSSEAMAAWTGLILWGEFTGDTRLRDLGVWLYATERSAIEEYWFDVHRENFPPAYAHAAAGIVWGGKTTYATWFSGKPEHILGINWLPFHGGSLYLAHAPGYAGRAFETLLREKGPEGKIDEWAELMLMYRALSDPADALARHAALGADFPRDKGVPLAQLEQWLRVMAELGTPDPTVWADTPLHAVFTRDGARAHAAYNAGREPREVRFSDGVVLTVPPGELAWRHADETRVSGRAEPPPAASVAEFYRPASASASAPDANIAATGKKPTSAAAGASAAGAAGAAYILDFGGAEQAVYSGDKYGPGEVVAATVEAGNAVVGDIDARFGPDRKYRLRVLATGGWNGGEGDGDALTGSFIYSNGSGGVGSPVKLALEGFAPGAKLRLEILKGYQGGREPTVTMSLPDGRKLAGTANVDGAWAQVGVLTGAAAYEGELANLEGGEADLAALRITVLR